MLNKKVPFGVKIISIVLIISALFLIVFSSLLIFSFDSLSTTLSNIPQVPFSKEIVSGVGLGIISIVLAMILIVIGIGLLRAKNFARIGASIFAGIGLLGSFINLLTQRWLSAISLVVYLGIFLYLIFNKKVKETFRQL